MARNYSANGSKSTKNRDRDSSKPFTQSDAQSVRYMMEEVRPLTEAQARYLAAIKSNPITFGVGPAGTGKTYLAVANAAVQLHNRKIEKILVTRPAVEAGEKLGFLPGELEEKFEPYLAPVKDVFIQMLGEGAYRSFLRSGNIEACPLGFLRGRSYDNTMILLDEAQNVTPAQMKMAVTRLGKNSRIIIDGDPTQKDIPGTSGLVDAMEVLRGLSGVRIIEFTRDDVVRSDIVQDVLERYEDRHRS